MNIQAPLSGLSGSGSAQKVWGKVEELGEKLEGSELNGFDQNIYALYDFQKERII